MEIVKRHEARQVPSWLIFDVGQNMKWFWLVPIISLLGCAARPWASVEERRAYGELIESSPTYLRAQGASPRRVIWYVQQSGEVPQFYVGFDMGTHSSREATLRIRSGVVERLVELTDDNYVWIVDR